mgnify:CR=1 FL=1
MSVADRLRMLSDLEEKYAVEQVRVAVSRFVNDKLSHEIFRNHLKQWFFVGKNKWDPQIGYSFRESLGLHGVKKSSKAIQML